MKFTSKEAEKKYYEQEASESEFREFDTCN